MLNPSLSSLLSSTMKSRLYSYEATLESCSSSEFSSLDWSIAHFSDCKESSLSEASTGMSDLGTKSSSSDSSVYVAQPHQHLIHLKHLQYYCWFALLVES
ncbi:hypothetical protein ACOSQ3_002859 [Xanthoceras sorbifolium]